MKKQQIEENVAQAVTPRKSLYAMWVHGHSATLQDRRVDNAKLRGVTHVNDAVDLTGYSRLQLHRKGWSGEFYFFDYGGKNYAKSGQVWVHYAIPTPVITNNQRVKAKDVLLRLEGSNQNLHIAEMHVWDGGDRIAVLENVMQWGQEKLVRYSIPNSPLIRYGLGVSILIKGDQVTARDRIQIYGVGVDFVL